ncbi:leucine-rich repeat-containing protein 75A [Pimephales promelas]|uniref:leucine-rich repeat-containing protein 75A n=1 Tax=Pimephales promelas TaxID=90988 RepID=UPI001955848E|nr:leucine-rich repeat-containing protein 75A [Pimephales promelas]XP_039526565.1 leucine-rich repeat-containing protein 75A [Pimephales promelas]KAG1951695.1 leucine-rich repeat-containing protein 75A [Pimephales promelas]
MGAKQTKAAGQEAGASPQSTGWKRTPTKDRSDILTSLMLRSGDKLRSSGTPPPYQRRIGMIQEMMLMAKQGKHDEATEMLKTLRQDLGMESTSLDDVLYRYASFRNLVDPITHDLIISLAKYIHCPKEGDALGSMEKVCRQLTYHLSPHSQWRRQGLLKRKPQSCLKSVLSSTPSSGALDLSGIPLGVKDMERLCAYLHHHASRIGSIELGFTELTDDAFLLLLPTLASLPRLETLALNGNRLTRAVLKELTDTLKDPDSFPNVTWIDLGNNVDIFSLPQPFLVSLRKRCPKKGNLPTILEFGESQASEPEGRVDEDDADDTNRTESMGELRSEVEEEIDGEMEIEDMMEELLDFDREVQGKEEEEDSLWTLEEQRLVKDPIANWSKEKRPPKAEGEEYFQSQSSHRSCSSPSQHSSGAIEPLREDSVPDQLACHSNNPT